MTPLAMELSACVRLPPLVVAPGPWMSERGGLGNPPCDFGSTMDRPRPPAKVCRRFRPPPGRLDRRGEMGVGRCHHPGDGRTFAALSRRLRR